MIPEEKQAAVTRALDEAFGANEFEEITLLTGGLSPSLVYQIVVKGSPYVLRIMMRTDAYADPTRQFNVWNTASDASLAPKVRYTSVEDKIMITDYVEAKPYPVDMAVRIAPVLRQVHALHNIPSPQSGNYFDSMNGYVQQFRAGNFLPENENEELFRRYDELTKVYPRDDAELVASHNDLKPQNMVFDGERIWLIDWEAAFLNDEYVDLSVVANFFVRSDAEEEAYLSAYFGEPAGEYRRARFFLMQQMLHIFYPVVMMVLAAKMGTTIDPDMTAPDFREFHEQLISGEVTLEGWDERIVYSKVHLNELIRNTRSPRFEEALAVVGSVKASA